MLCCSLSRTSCIHRGEWASLQAGRAPGIFLIAAAEDKNEEQEPLGEWSLWRPRSPRPLPCDWCSGRSSGRSEFISTNLLQAVSILFLRMAAAIRCVVQAGVFLLGLDLKDTCSPASFLGWKYCLQHLAVPACSLNWALYVLVAP